MKVKCPELTLTQLKTLNKNKTIITSYTCCTEPSPGRRRPGKPCDTEDRRSLCYAAGSKSHRPCSERATASSGPRQACGTRSHCILDNTDKQHIFLKN